MLRRSAGPGERQEHGFPIAEIQEADKGLRV